MTTGSGKPARGIGQPVVFDIRDIWTLRAGVRIVEICSGREFVVDKRRGILWHGTTRCTPHVLDMPVQIISGPDQKTAPQ